MGGHCPWFHFWKKRKANKESKEISELQASPDVNACGTKITAAPRMQAPVPEERPDVDISKAKTFTYQELAAATENFREQNFLGQGGFGPVYKGLIGQTGEVVAVKQLDKGGFQGEKEFLVEVLMLSLMRHPNLVNLIGYCAEEDHRLLVYEYMPLGSLEDHLLELPPDTKPLDWNTRMNIAAGAARGLEYLHDKADPPVIYRDLKAANILLDVGFHPKLSDFGLAKFGPTDDKSHVSTRVMGTHGYCAPEYATTGKLTVKSDIFSFGVLLLELITGRPAMDDALGHERMLVDWVRPRFKDRKNVTQLADPTLNGQFSESMLKKALNIAFVCTQENPSVRPSISDVVLALDYLIAHPYDPNKTYIKRPDGQKSAQEKTKILDKDLDRERAVAEAKMWGETLREKRLQDAKSSLDEVKSHEKH